MSKYSPGDGYAEVRFDSIYTTDPFRTWFAIWLRHSCYPVAFGLNTAALVAGIASYCSTVTATMSLHSSTGAQLTIVSRLL